MIIVIGIAAIVPHNAIADSLMEEISLFVEENCEAEILEEKRILHDFCVITPQMI